MHHVARRNRGPLNKVSAAVTVVPFISKCVQDGVVKAEIKPQLP